MTNKRARFALNWFVPLVVLVTGGAAIVTSGCGGSDDDGTTGGGGGTTRDLGVSAQFAAITRQVPSYVTKVEVTVTAPTGVTYDGGTVTLNRPSGDAGGSVSGTFNDVPVSTGAYTLNATMFNGSTEVGSATTEVTVSGSGADPSVNFSAALADAGTAASVAVVGGDATVTVGQTGTLSAEVKDADGNVLFTSSNGSAISWSSNNAALTLAAASGAWTANSAGTATATATLSGTGLSGSADITVVPSSGVATFSIDWAAVQAVRSSQPGYVNTVVSRMVDGDGVTQDTVITARRDTSAYTEGISFTKAIPNGEYTLQILGYAAVVTLNNPNPGGPALTTVNVPVFMVGGKAYLDAAGTQPVVVSTSNTTSTIASMKLVQTTTIGQGTNAPIPVGASTDLSGKTIYIYEGQTLSHLGGFGMTASNTILLGNAGQSGGAGHFQLRSSNGSITGNDIVGINQGVFANNNPIFIWGKKAGTTTLTFEPTNGPSVSTTVTVNVLPAPKLAANSATGIRIGFLPKVTTAALAIPGVNLPGTANLTNAAAASFQASAGTLADQSALVTIGGNLTFSNPALNSDGTKIAFVVNSDNGRSVIAVADVRYTEPTVTQTAGVYSFDKVVLWTGAGDVRAKNRPTWDKSGNLYYEQADTAPAKNNIYRSTGPNVATNLTAAIPGNMYYPVVDGARLAFISDNNVGAAPFQSSIVIMPSTGGTVTAQSSNLSAAAAAQGILSLQANNTNAYTLGLAWSNDGTQLYYSDTVGNIVGMTAATLNNALPAATSVVVPAAGTHWWPIAWNGVLIQDTVQNPVQDFFQPGRNFVLWNDGTTGTIVGKAVGTTGGFTTNFGFNATWTQPRMAGPAN